MPRDEEEKRRDEEGRKRMHKALTNRIDKLCEERELSYYKLAYRASIPQSSLVNIMKGVSVDPGIYNIMKICDGFGITMAEFFNNKIFEDAMVESRNEN